MENIPEIEAKRESRVESRTSISPPGSTSSEYRKPLIAVPEARYFVESLKDWYDRPRAVSYATAPQSSSRLHTVRRGSWHPGSTVDIRGKSVVDFRSIPRPGSPQTGAVVVALPGPHVSEMKDKLLTVNKDELVDLVLQYYNELVGLGRTREASRLLESVIHDDLFLQSN